MRNDNLCTSGIVLWEALVRFSNKNLWREYVAHMNESARGIDSFSQSTENPSIQDLFIGLQKITSAYMNNKNKERELFNKLVNQFKLKFKSQKLFAYGYSLPRKTEDKPNLIPFDVIANGEINWGNSSINGNGLEFMGVMVFKKPLIDYFNESSISIGNKQELINKSKKRKGRPSNKELIKTIYLEEKNREAIDFSNSKKMIFEELEKTIAEKKNIPFNKDTNHYEGLGYTAINNAIGPLVDKEKRKQPS